MYTQTCLKCVNQDITNVSKLNTKLVLKTRIRQWTPLYLCPEPVASNNASIDLVIDCITQLVEYLNDSKTGCLKFAHCFAWRVLAFTSGRFRALNIPQIDMNDCVLGFARSMSRQHGLHSLLSLCFNTGNFPGVPCYGIRDSRLI